MDVNNPFQPLPKMDYSYIVLKKGCTTTPLINVELTERVYEMWRKLVEDFTCKKIDIPQPRIVNISTKHLTNYWSMLNDTKCAEVTKLTQSHQDSSQKCHGLARAALLKSFVISKLLPTFLTAEVPALVTQTISHSPPTAFYFWRLFKITNTK